MKILVSKLDIMQERLTTYKDATKYYMTMLKKRFIYNSLWILPQTESVSTMLVRKVQLKPSVFLAHAKVLESELTKYTIRWVVCKTYTIPAGNMDGNHEKLFTDNFHEDA